MRKYLAFDIETANVTPKSGNDILSLRPLGICCAAAVAQDIGEQLVWHGRNASGAPSEKMTRDEVGQLVRDLCDLSNKGYTIVTWNGLAFDFDVLAEESGLLEECSQLALSHVDMLFHGVCILGHRVSLQKAADGMGLRGKLAGICSADAPIMWAACEYQKVIDYCIQDVRCTLELAAGCEKIGELRWISRQGETKKMPLPGGWLTVDEALQLPEIDTSWMSDPPRREQFTKWISNQIGAV